MKTVWEYTPELEAKRLLHNAHQIATGFYKLNGFLPLPFGDCPNLDNCVTFPNLNYLSIPRFWDQASRLNVSTLPISVPPRLLSQTQNLLIQAKLPKPDFQKTQLLWATRQDKIISTIYDLIPNRKNSISKIIIWPTAFGTSCSFNLCDKPPYDIIIWLRQDQGIAAIVEAILTSLTRKDVYEHLGGLWQESEIIVDWILAYSPLAKLLPSVPKTIKSTRTKQNAALVQKSDEFLRQISAPTVSPAQIDTSHFSPTEKTIFNLLLSKSPNIVTFDEINELTTNNYEQFSLYAISKSIQRLRDKLEASGISGSFIQTKRGEGYLLVN